MTPPPAPPSPAAVAAFLRGLDRRARLFATVQAGDARCGERALAAVARVFAVEAGQWPLAQWPTQYWRLLLSTPALRHAEAPAASAPLPGIARLPFPQRAAVLLHLVAGLQDADAASALGIDIPAYQAAIRDSLPNNEVGQPDVDVWRAWRAAAQRELERAPEPPPLAKQATDAPASASASRVASPAPQSHARWLWLGIVACVLAFAAAFFIHPAGREALQQWFATIKREPLPPADPPKARFDASDAALHPDRDLLASPHELFLAQALPLLAWQANAMELASAEQASVQPASVELPAQPAAVSASDGAAAFAQRMRAWDALPPRVRGERRAAWQAWRALPANERVQLRGIATRIAQLPLEKRMALHAQFDAQPFDVREGWWLGPRLGRDWPRVAALFAYVDAAERERMLDVLRAASPTDIDVLARLAQTTPPEARAALRRDLLAQSAAQRGAWLQMQLQ